jgi:glycosyltransferase involved in cell wall biosynthesis
MPYRGVEILAKVWDKISEEIPEALLVITADMRLWNPKIPEFALVDYKPLFLGLPNVHYFGALNRSELIQHELESQINLATNTYEELFCISVAECQVAGAIPISTNFGAIRTTNMGKILLGNPEDKSWQNKYADIVIKNLQNQVILNRDIKNIQKKALKRFSPEVILQEWEERVFK